MTATIEERIALGVPLAVGALLCLVVPHDDQAADLEVLFGELTALRESLDDHIDLLAMTILGGVLVEQLAQALDDDPSGILQRVALAIAARS